MYAKLVFIHFIIASFLCLSYADRKSDNRLKDLKAVEKLQPLLDGPNVFFWRPQKVGSSTLLSILMSYGYRYNYLPKRKSSSNAYCRLLAKCAIATKSYPHNISYSYLEDYVTSRVPGTPMKGQYLTTRDLEAERLSNSVGFKISLSHEICNLNAQVIHQNIECSFNKLSKVVQENNKLNPVKELFMLREPLSRAISVYYFWGELYKMKHGMKTNRNDKISKKERNGEHRNLAWEGELKLGQSDLSKPVVITGQKFKYHGLENTPPPYDIAMYYANHSVYRTGMPGPSYTWSAYADNLSDALDILKSDRICTIVLERLAESLVVAVHYLNWSLADVVVTKHRKALSSHPKHTAWPKPAVDLLVSQFNAPEHGEYAMYNASLLKLNERIERLTRQGVDVPAEVVKLNMLQKRVTEVRILHVLYVVLLDLLLPPLGLLLYSLYILYVYLYSPYLICLFVYGK